MADNNNDMPNWMQGLDIQNGVATLPIGAQTEGVSSGGSLEKDQPNGIFSGLTSAAGGTFWGKAVDSIFFKAESVEDAVANMDRQRDQQNTIILVVGMLVLAAMIGGIFFIALKKTK